MTINFDEVFDASAPSLYAAAPMMAEPAHPGDLMRELIESTGLTITQAAQAAQIQRTHLSAMLSGDKPVSIHSAMKFEAAFGGPSPTVLHGMSDLFESAKALRKRDDLVGTIARMTEDRVKELKAVKNRAGNENKRVAKAV